MADSLEDYILSGPSEEEKKAAPEHKGPQAKGVPTSKKGAWNSLSAGLGNELAALPDMAIEGILKGGHYALGDFVTPQLLQDIDNKDYVRRFLAPSDYSQKDYLFGVWPYGKGEADVLPETTTEKAMSAAGHAMGLGAGITAGLIKKGATTAIGAAPVIYDELTTGNRLQRGIGHLKTMWDDMLRDYAHKPGMAAATDAVANAGGAALGTTEQELTGQRSGVGDLVGSAPAAATNAVARLGAKAGYELLTHVSPTGYLLRKAAEKAGPEVVGRAKDAYNVVRENFDPQRVGATTNRKVRSILEEAYASAEQSGDLEMMNRLKQRMQEVGTQAPDFSAAELTNDPILLGEQKRLQQKAKGTKARENRTRVNVNTDRVRAFIDGKNLHDDAAPSGVIDALAERRSKELADVSDELTENRIDLESQADRIPGLKYRAAENARIREALDKERKLAEVDMDSLAGDIGLNEIKPKYGVEKLKQRLAEMFIPENSLIAKRQTPQFVKDFLDMDEKQINFQEWRKMRREIGKELDDANRFGNTNVEDLAKLKAEWDDFGARAFKNAHPLMEKFNEAYIERMMPFERGKVYRTLEKSADNRSYDVRYRTDDEQVAAAFLKNAESARDFMNISNTPGREEGAQMREAMRNIVLDDIRQAAGKVPPNSPWAGGLNPHALEKYLNQKREVLEELGLDGVVKDVHAVTDAIGARNRTLMQRQKVISQGKLNKLLEQYSSDEALPEDIISKALGDYQLAKQLSKAVRETGDEEVSKELTSAAWTRLIGEDKSILRNPAALKKLISENRGSLNVLVGQKHLNDLELAAEGLARIAAGAEGVQGKARAGAQSLPEVFEEKTGTSARSVSAGLRSITRGHGSVHDLATFMGVRYWTANRERSWDNMMEAALRDGQLAEDIAHVASRKKIPNGVVERRLKSAMFNMGMKIDGSPYGEPQSGDIFSEEELNDPNPRPLTFTVKPSGSGAAPITSDPPQTPQTTSPAPLAGPPASMPPAPASMPSATPYSALFPNDPTGAAIQQRRGYADGGYVYDGKFGDHYAPYEDRTGEPLPEDVTPEQMAYGQKWKNAILSNMEQMQGRKLSQSEMANIDAFVSRQMKDAEGNFASFKGDPRMRGIGMLLTPKGQDMRDAANRRFVEEARRKGIPGFAEGGEVSAPFPKRIC